MAVNNLFHKPLHFEFYVLVVLLEELFEQYLNYRQYVFVKKNLSRTEDFIDKNRSSDLIYKKTLDSVKVYLDSEDYTKTVEYSLDKLTFQIFSSIFNTILSLVLLFILFLPKLWNFSGILFKNNSEYVQSLVFCGFKSLFDTAVDIPFSLYSDFVIEEKHGFNKKTLGLFVKDTLLKILLQCIIGGPVLLVLIFLVNWGGDVFYFYVFGFIVLFTFFMLVIYPEFIAPLFNKFEPIKDQELKCDIENLAKKLGFPLREIKQMDGSKRTSHSNAYLYGLWKFKKVVIYDNLLEADRKQVLAVVGHEFGHWKHNHFIKMTTFSFANLFLLFYLFKSFKDDNDMFNSFGFHGVNCFVIGFSLFSYIFTLVGTVTNIVVTTLSRYNEYQADRFAVNLGLGEDLSKALLFLTKDNKGMIYQDRLYSWYHFTHPVMFERLYSIYQAIDKTK